MFQLYYFGKSQRISPAAFFIFSRGNKNAKVLERGLPSIPFWEIQKRKSSEVPEKWAPYFFFFSSFWCYQLHCVNVISGIQWAGLHHTNLDSQLRHSLIRTNMILILSLIPSPSPQGHEGLELFFL